MASGIFNRHTGYHNRKSTRLRNFDYSQPGYYFITICIKDQRQPLFGEVVNRKMILNDAGLMVQQYWSQIPDHHPHVELDEFQVMPNHLHGIIILKSDGVHRVVGVQNFEPLQNRCHPKNRYQHIIPGSIGSIIRGFKIGVTKWFRSTNPGINIWHRNFHDHVIRDENSLYLIRKYIRDNPGKWAMDHENHLNREIGEIEKLG